MRMKEDHMRNGQTKPGYNIQIGTENQFIVCYSIHQKPGDSSLLIPHIKKLKKQINKLPKNIIADAGYGSEENYEFIKKNKMKNYVKFNYFHKEQKKNYKNNIYRVENLKYNKKKDEFICPSGKRMFYLETIERKTDNGYKAKRRIYQCEDCANCNLRKDCHRSKYNRKIQVSFKLNKLKDEARKNLKSEKGLKYRSRRCVDVEPVFGQIKSNRLFKRFLLRGLDKVNIEWGLLSFAHNIMKIPT